MLKGYLNCKDISKLLLGYIHFELNKKNHDARCHAFKKLPRVHGKIHKNSKKKKRIKAKNEKN